MPDIYIADISEWQGPLDWSRYPYPAVICRLNYGAFYSDRFAARNIAGARARCSLRGWYTYLVGGQAPEPQADLLAAILLSAGGLQPGEFVVCDDEEGGGDQTPRVHAFFDRLHQRLHEPENQDWLYSGLYFARTHLSGLRPGIHRWLAAYGMSEMADHHDLWQFTSGASVAGIAGGVDLSIFHGTLDQLTALIGGAPIEDPMPNLLVQGDGQDPRGAGAVYFVPNFPQGPKRYLPSNAVVDAYKSTAAQGNPQIATIQRVNQYVLDDIVDEESHYRHHDDAAFTAKLDQLLAKSPPPAASVDVGALAASLATPLAEAVKPLVPLSVDPNLIATTVLLVLGRKLAS